MSERVLTAIEGRIMTIRINRPDKRNALTREMYADLEQALSRARDDAAVRVVLVTGSGGCFCAGNDLQEFLHSSGNRDDLAAGGFLQQLAAVEKPLVAAVEGVAVGIGTTMLLHCDLVFAARDTRFSLPFVDLGLVPEAGSTLLLPRLAGYQRAAELLMLGGEFGADAAERAGLVNAVCPAGSVCTEALAAARRLAAKPPGALAATKRLMKADRDAIRGHMDTEAALFAERLQSPEAREALTAFVEKRAPDFERFD